MGSQFVDGSGSWGGIGNSIAGAITGAPGTALSNINVAEHIKASRAEQIRKQAEFEATQGAGNAAYQAVMSMTPPESTRDITVVPQGPLPPSQIPADTPDNSGGFLPPYQTQESYLDPAVVERFKKEQPMFAATARAQAFKDPHNLPDVYARGRVGLTGVPDDPGELNRLRFLTKGDIDRSKDANYVVVAQDDPTKVLRILGTGDGTYSTDGKTKFADVARSVGGVVMKTGDAGLNTKPRTMFDDEAARVNALTDASIRIRNGVLPDSVQTQKLAMALSLQYPAIEKVMQDAIGNSSILHNFVETMPPGPLKPLLAHIAKTMYGAPAAPSVFPAVGPDGAPVPTATAAAPSVPPIYDPTRPPEQTILSRAPPTQEMIKEARALGLTRQARAAMEDMLGVTEDANGNAVVPADGYTPNWGAAIVQERFGTGTIQNVILNKLDSQALEYFTNARAWVEPVLRIASGAVTPPQEVVTYMQMFIPNFTDSPQLKAQKITRMRVWEQATSASTANEALNMIMKDPRTDPEMRAVAEKMRVRATQAGTLNTPTTALPALGGARGTGAVAAPPTTPAVLPPPTRGAGAPGAGAAVPPVIQRGNAVFGD